MDEIQSLRDEIQRLLSLVAEQQREIERLRKLPPAAETWWGPAGFTPPFTPGLVRGNNDGCVRDSAGVVIADCGGCEARADVIADLLNAASASPATGAAETTKDPDEENRASALRSFQSMPQWKQDYLREYFSSQSEGPKR